MKAEDVVPVKAVALKSINDHSGLQSIIKVSEAEYHCVVGAISFDKTDRFEAGEWPEKI